jgi:HEPN domain-containing protein
MELSFMKNQTREWLKAAKDDLNVISLIQAREDLTHVIAFHAQQAIEKTFKGVLEEFEIPVIKSHNLQYLYYTVSETINLELDLKLLATLDSLYIESRYPGSMGLLPEGKPSLTEARIFLEFASHVFQTITETLSKYTRQ